MKILILAGMLVVFISAIFILLILTDASEKYMECTPVSGNVFSCSVPEIGVPFVFSLMLVGAFVLIDCLVVYLLIKSLEVKGSFGYTAVLE